LEGFKRRLTPLRKKFKKIMIALDLDGVLADTMRLWIKIWKQRTGYELRYEDLVEWDFWRRLGITSQEFMRIMDEAWRQWRYLPPTEENLSEKVSLLKTLGRIDIVTARPKPTEEYAFKWLEYHKIPYDNYVWIGSMREKILLDYDVYIDDSPIVAEEASINHKLILLYDRPWNSDIAETNYVKRVKSLSQAYRILRDGLGR